MNPLSRSMSLPLPAKQPLESAQEIMTSLIQDFKEILTGDNPIKYREFYYRVGELKSQNPSVFLRIDRLVKLEKEKIQSWMNKGHEFYNNYLDIENQKFQDEHDRLYSNFSQDLWQDEKEMGYEVQQNEILKNAHAWIVKELWFLFITSETEIKDVMDLVYPVGLSKLIIEAKK